MSRLSKKSLESENAAARTARFIAKTRKLAEQPSLHEHDLVRVTKDVDSDGYSVKKGMTGTIVSVYNAGEAFAVEFPEIEDAPAVVTLDADAIERVAGRHQ